MDKQPRDFQEIYLTHRKEIQKHMNSDEVSPYDHATLRR
jgi:hypothetical protein